MQKATYYLSAMLMVACFTQPATAQFEGEITYESYDYNNDQKENNDEFTLHITPDRILLQGEKEYDFMGSMKTEGVLVRLDQQDFVFLTGDESALKIAKADITSMMNMFGNGNEVSSAAEKYDIQKNRTGETGEIKGYSAEKFIFRDEEGGQGDYAEVWMTKAIDVNWGMLAEPWGNEDASTFMNDSFPMDLVFQEKYIPLLVKTYKGDVLHSGLEVASINESRIDRSIVEVPSDVKVLTMQQYLFQKMSNR
ncbi:hypothetical protein [Fodinibius salsisoli]|uniref:DUF4412 domain-containing protein n=1 Tax=Fodinibius salsisoli TaxID=2820877 RepID=A0ABT3PPJ8_9BACT|nr:hypothetical protein [Fodinibius salsisoli]MCW9707788.1 hypothetical protein [Fodinibius salsisoli]